VEFNRTEQLFNLVRFGLQYQGKVANPGDMICKKNKIESRATGLRNGEVIDEDAFENVQVRILNTSSIIWKVIQMIKLSGWLIYLDGMTLIILSCSF
jgi:hypothetical protein